MESLSYIIDKSIDQVEVVKSLKELRLEYREKYRQILKIKDNPESSEYKKLKEELGDNLSKREVLASKG